MGKVTALISCAEATDFVSTVKKQWACFCSQPPVKHSAASKCCSTHSYCYSTHVQHKYCSKVAFVSLSIPEFAIVFTDEETHFTVRQQTWAVFAICKRFKHEFWPPHAVLFFCPDKDTVTFAKYWLYQEPNMYYSLTYKLIVPKPVENFHAFYGTRRFITVVRVTRQLTLSWDRSNQSRSSNLIYLMYL